MATNAAFPPYEYVEGGKIVGLDPMMATAICDKLGKNLVIDDMEFDSVIHCCSDRQRRFRYGRYDRHTGKKKK